MNAHSTLPRIADQALNKWPGVLAHFGVAAQSLSGKQTPCPICGGRDRFRFDNLEGRGTWICNACGAGDGIDLLKRVKGWQFREAVEQVRSILGEVREVKAKKKVDDGRALQLCRDLWRRGARIGDDDAGAYLASRAIVAPYPSVLRFCAETEVSGHPRHQTLPAMLALVSGPDGQAVNIHRTYLEDGRKAEWVDPATGLPASCRRMMPGRVPDGSAIRLFPHDGRLGVGEGIETAWHAGRRFGVPAWAVINSTMLAKFVPPAEVSELHVFGDNDAKFGGQAAAYQVAHRVAVKPDAPLVEVHVPSVIGEDWADARG